jgi:hypothetical protein
MEGHLGLLKNLKGVEGKSEALKSKVRRSMKAGAESGSGVRGPGRNGMASRQQKLTMPANSMEGSSPSPPTNLEYLIVFLELPSTDNGARQRARFRR